MHKPKTDFQLICLPYSGGGAHAFHPLKDNWPDTWEIKTLSFPGRGRRLNEPLLVNMEELVEDCWFQIKRELKKPYAIFGHSLGSTLAFILTHKIRHEGYPLPIHLFLSGTDGPSVPAEKPFRHLMTKGELKEKLKYYGGIPEEILNSAPAFDFFEPIIRADFQAIETWNYLSKPKLTVRATVITGNEEDITEEDIRKWQLEFESDVKFIRIYGNHFYLFEHPERLVDVMQDELTSNPLWSINTTKPVSA